MALKVYLICFSLLLFVGGCALTGSSEININTVNFLNTTNAEVIDAKLYVKANHGQVQCSVVEPNSQCGTGFPAKAYKGGELIISWQVDNEKYEKIAKLTAPDSEKAIYKLDVIFQGANQLALVVN